MMQRGYQEEFYASSERVGDRFSREKKAEKIGRALKQRIPDQLHQAICLDVGCSSGLITHTLAPLFSKTVGLDYDPTALKAADASVRERVKLIHGDAMRLPFGNGVIDVIICAQVYEHVPSPETLFDEMYRVLRPGGLVFFSGPNWLFPIEPHYLLPFLHWLPRPIADICVRLTGRANTYYERSRHWWGLRHLARQFVLDDITADVLQDAHLSSREGLLFRVAQRIPAPFWEALTPLMPNFNWILHKKEASTDEDARS